MPKKYFPLFSLWVYIKLFIYLPVPVYTHIVLSSSSPQLIFICLGKPNQTKHMLCNAMPCAISDHNTNNHHITTTSTTTAVLSKLLSTNFHKKNVARGMHRQHKKIQEYFCGGNWLDFNLTKLSCLILSLYPHLPKKSNFCHHFSPKKITTKVQQFFMCILIRIEIHTYFYSI